MHAKCLTYVTTVSGTGPPGYRVHRKLEGLLARLEDEFELRERRTALERKLGLMPRTSHTLLEQLSHRHTLRVEWNIVLLIVLELRLSPYTLVFR